MKRALSISFLCLLLATPAWAGFNEGWEAYEKGDYSTALREWRPLAEQGNAQAQYNVGFMYANGKGVDQDSTEAARWYRKAAEQGFADALHNLGVMYHSGDGVPHDHAEANKWFLRAAALGHSISSQFRAQIFESMTSDEIEKAQKQAREWVAKRKK